MYLKNKQLGFANPVTIGVIAITLIVVGFAGYRIANSNEKKQLNSTEQRAKTSDVLPLDLNGVLEVSKIKELAVGSSSASVSNLELENEHGQLLYKVTLSDGSVVVLDAKTGAKVTGDKTTAEVEDDQDVLPANFTVSVSFDKAREIAQAKFPSGSINKIELDVENGKVVLSVRFSDKARVDVDANTGAIVKTKDPKATQPAQNSTNQLATPTTAAPTTNRSSSNSSSGSSGSGNSGSGSTSSNSGSGSSNSGSGSSGSGSSSSGDDNDSDEDSSDDSSGSNSGSGGRH